MDDALFLRVGLLPLVVFGKEPVAGLVSGGGNSGLPLAPLDDFYVVVWAWHFTRPPVPIFGQKKSRKPEKISCLTIFNLEPWCGWQKIVPQTLSPILFKEKSSLFLQTIRN